jgi:hypothetical protein
MLNTWPALYISNKHALILLVTEYLLTFEQFLLPEGSSSPAGLLSKILLIKYGTAVADIVFNHCMKTASSKENTLSIKESRKNTPVNAKQTHVQQKKYRLFPLKGSRQF